MIKNMFQMVVVGLLIIYLVIAPVIIFPMLSANAQLINRENEIDYYGVLELWNVDTFEGGSVGRNLWLERRALEFEANHPGTFIMVRNMNEEQALLNLENGNKPDLISYGIGIGSEIVSDLTNYTGAVNVRDDLLVGGKVNGEILAMPYILGGYSLIGNESYMQSSQSGNDYDLLNNVLNFATVNNKDKIYSLSMGANSYTNPALALVLNTVCEANENSIDEKINEYTSYDAYVEYVMGNNSSVLLGTQRDVYRCKNRENNSKMDANVYKFLGGFSDLIQYISIFNTDNKTKYICENFIEYITTEDVQRTLSAISMFSTLDIDIYSSTFYSEWEKVLAKNLNTFSVFMHKESIAEKISIAISALEGETSAQNKVNNLFS